MNGLMAIILATKEKVGPPVINCTLLGLEPH